MKARSTSASHLKNRISKQDLTSDGVNWGERGMDQLEDQERDEDAQRGDGRRA